MINLTTQKKIGRPTANPKIKSTRIRLTEEQDQKLTECSEVLKISRTDVLIKGLDTVYQDIKK
ncbi:hypothetical protein P7J61_08920 [Streptococcus suis]|nr:hypothetical protein [Streptococcus suis]